MSKGQTQVQIPPGTSSVAPNPVTQVQTSSGASPPATNLGTQGRIPHGVIPSVENSRTTSAQPKPRTPKYVDGYTLTPETLHKVESISKLSFSFDVNAFRVRNTETEFVIHCSTSQEAMSTAIDNHEVLL